MKTSTVRILLLSGFLFCSAASQAADELTFYGAIKTSIDSVNDGAETELSVSNNSTRVGIKGSKNLKENLDVVYQIELGVDTTERSKIDSGRNSYVGLQGQFGKLLVGQHDTPFKDIRDHGAELFNDTLAGSRSMISAVANDGGAKLDNRVKNAILYYSPKMAGTQVFLLYSADTSGAASPDDNNNDLSSASVAYKQGGLYLGLAFEKKSNPGSVDTESARLAASFKSGNIQFGGIIETSDNGDNDALTRDAAAINARYNVSNATWLGIQYAVAEEFDGSTDSGGSNVSLGIQHKLAKPTTVYAVLSMTQNDDNAAFGLSQGGIQDSVVASAAGEDVRGASVGIVHKF